MQDIIANLGPSILLFAKALVLILLSIYMVFAFIVVKQVNLMTRTLELGLEETIRVFAYLHLFFALGILLISFFVL
jgi:hypothetical protein